METKTKEAIEERLESYKRTLQVGWTNEMLRIAELEGALLNAICDIAWLYGKVEGNDKN